MPLIIYEINTRVWLRQFDTNKKKATLSDVPSEYWKSLANKGIKLIWLMGVWETNRESIEKYCFTEDLKIEYDNALSDWSKNDVIGSPYAINNYLPDSNITSLNELITLRKKLNGIGLKLILDYIPNHFNSLSPLLKTNPEIFLSTNNSFIEIDKNTFFKTKSGKVYAHGKDPNFPAWEDTVQINYFSNVARSFMINALRHVAELCDGVRCDMAMLPLNNEFYHTWKRVLSLSDFDFPKDEFWELAISSVKKTYPDFIFIAEAYWNLEWHLQQIGFDYTYDKRLLERLQYGDTESVLMHLRADEGFQKKSIRFIENHDEKRAVTAFGKLRSLAAAVVITTINGLTLFNDGQFEGKRIKLPVQLGREPKENIDQEIADFYSKLLSIVSSNIFISGTWSLLQPIQIENDFSFKNFFAWEWIYKNNKRIIVINYSEYPSYCRLKFDINKPENNISLVDLLAEKEYKRNKTEIHNEGLFIHLEPYQSHIFSII